MPISIPQGPFINYDLLGQQIKSRNMLKIVTPLQEYPEHLNVISSKHYLRRGGNPREGVQEKMISNFYV